MWLVIHYPRHCLYPTINAIKFYYARTVENRHNGAAADRSRCVCSLKHLVHPHKKLSIHSCGGNRLQNQTDPIKTASSAQGLEAACSCVVSLISSTEQWSRCILPGVCADSLKASVMAATTGHLQRVISSLTDSVWMWLFVFYQCTPHRLVWILKAVLENR